MSTAASSSAAQGSIDIKDVSRTYIDANGNLVEALSHIDLHVRPGEFISFIGPSGCGKTTLLRLIAGLDQPQAGSLDFDGAPITSTHYERSYVFQQSNLFPWETVEGNIAAGLKARRVYKERKGEIADYVRLAGLQGFEKVYPHQISGGMAQRVSLVRALINDAKALLLDEPLGALDAFTRMDLQDKILELWYKRRTTIVLVTHDVDEAVYLSDRIVVMTPRPGRIDEIIDNQLPRPRARTSDEFIALRKLILERLHLATQTSQPEYFI